MLTGAEVGYSGLAEIRSGVVLADDTVDDGMLLNDVKDHLVSLIEFALHRRPQPDSTQNFSFATLAQRPRGTKSQAIQLKLGSASELICRTKGSRPSPAGNLFINRG
ncbi:MAG: hypothetical protein ABGZ35_10360 [Planctomycetaceae bacterium]